MSDGTQENLVQFDPATGAVLSVVAATGATGRQVGTSTFDPVNQRYFFLGERTPSKHFVVDIPTGSVSSFISSIPDPAHPEYEYFNCTAVCPLCKTSNVVSSLKDSEEPTSLSSQNVASEGLFISVYPNPVSDEAVFLYNVGYEGKITLKIYDQKGRLICPLMKDKFHESGNYKITWKTNSLSSGIYYYTLIASDEVINQKMILVK